IERDGPRQRRCGTNAIAEGPQSRRVGKCPGFYSGSDDVVKSTYPRAEGQVGGEHFIRRQFDLVISLRNKADESDRNAGHGVRHVEDADLGPVDTQADIHNTHLDTIDITASNVEHARDLAAGETLRGNIRYTGDLCTG